MAAGYLGPPVWETARRPGQLRFAETVAGWGVPFSRLSRSTEAAVGYFELGMMEAALGELDQLSPADQQETEVLELRSVIHQQTGRWAEAAMAFRALCNRRDAELEHFIGWGCCLHEIGAHDEARKALLSAPGAFRSNGLWNYHLACYEALCGRSEDARSRVERAIQLDPRLRRMAQQNTHLAPLLGSAS